MLRVGDVAVARQLVALVPVLASALAVALPGDRRDTAAGLAELAGGEPEPVALVVAERPRVLEQVAREVLQALEALRVEHQLLVAEGERRVEDGARE